MPRSIPTSTFKFSNQLPMSIDATTDARFPSAPVACAFFRASRVALSFLLFFSLIFLFTFFVFLGLLCLPVFLEKNNRGRRARETSFGTSNTGIGEFKQLHVSLKHGEREWEPRCRRQRRQTEAEAKKSSRWVSSQRRICRGNSTPERYTRGNFPPWYKT